MLFSQKDKTPSRKKNNNDFLGGVPPFDPLTFDSANLIALYDGDILGGAGIWQDQSANGFDLTLVNNPQVGPSTNGHQGIRFDGVSQYGNNNNAAFLTTQPYSIYIVFNQITWGNNLYFYDDGNLANAKTFLQVGGSPVVGTFAGVLLVGNPDPPLNNYEIMTHIYNGANSEIRTNNNAAVIGNAGIQNGQGINVASQTAGVGNFCNCEIAYIILRSAADSTATQNLFINYLKNRFAL
jgi:hypothetical protein